MVRSKRSSLPPFKLQFRSYKKEDLERARQKNPKHKADHVDRDIPRSEWYMHGFSETMTLEQAREHASKKNAQKKLEDERRARAWIKERFKEEDLVECAFLSPGLVADFEEKLKREQMDEVDFESSKMASHWRAVKRVIRAIQVDPKDWEEEQTSIYKFFARQGWSISYCEKLLILMNKWGYFCAKRSNTFYQPLQFPRSKWRRAISDAYFEKVDNRTKESAPLKETHLVKAKDKLKPEQFNWLYISFWFGLRPKEVDSLKSKPGKYWNVEIQKGKRILKVYQPKLVDIERDRRWKLIPCIFDEQEHALKLIQAGEIKRPLVKTLRHHLGDGLTTYAGRKGFEALLHSRGIPFAAISAYLGHIDVNRTWNNYRERERTVFPEEFAEYQSNGVIDLQRQKRGA